jgi:hypothetical protein
MEFEVRRDSVTGQRIRSVDLDRETPGDLPPGNYVLVVRWPAGVIGPNGRTGGFLQGGKVFYDVPAAPAAPPAPAVPSELASALRDLATSQAASARAMESIGDRLDRLERAPHAAAAPAAGAMGSPLMERFLEATLTRALAPQPDPLSSLRGLLELQASLRDALPKSDPPAPVEKQSIGVQLVEAARDAIDAIPDAAERIAKARAMSGMELLTPALLLRQIPTLPDKTLAGWLADAVECGLVHKDVLGGGGEQEASEAGSLIGAALRLSPGGVERFRTVVVGAVRLLGAQPTAQESEDGGSGTSGSPDSRGQPRASAGAPAGGTAGVGAT